MYFVVLPLFLLIYLFLPTSLSIVVPRSLPVNLKGSKLTMWRIKIWLNMGKYNVLRAIYLIFTSILCQNYDDKVLSILLKNLQCLEYNYVNILTGPRFNTVGRKAHATTHCNSNFWLIQQKDCLVQFFSYKYSEFQDVFSI